MPHSISSGPFRPFCCDLGGSSGGAERSNTQKGESVTFLFFFLCLISLMAPEKHPR